MEPSKALIEAGARALCEHENRAAELWDFESDASRAEYMEQATACLRAAMVGVEVVYTNTSNGPVDVMTGSVFRVCTLPNDRILLLRAEVE